MSGAINNVLSAVQQALQQTSRGLVVRDGEFGDTLRLGQIIKGRVMRHYEGQRYMVDFSGQQKVVDSTVPLRTSELITSRVIGLGDKVHLQRLNSAADAAVQIGQSMSATNTGSRAQQLLETLFSRYNATLPVVQLNTAVNAVRQAGNGQIMAYSALVLHKLGLEMSPHLLNALYQRLSSSKLSAEPISDTPRPSAVTAVRSEHPVAQLTTLLHNVFGDISSEASLSSDDNDADKPETQRDPDMDFSGDERHRQRQPEWQLGQWLLGVQSHPRIAHQILHIPVWFGERLVEVSVALYSQNKQQAQNAELNYRRIVFFVKTEHLGQVQITVNAADRHLRLEIASDSESATHSMARFVSELRQTLASLEWMVDEVKYVEATSTTADVVAASVVHHHISNDSLSRLM